MTAIPGPPPLEPTQDERTMATLAQALSILGFLAPLIIFLIKRQSRFVSFHALQALLWHIAYLVIAMIAAMGWIFMIFFAIAHTATAKDAAPPVGLFFILPLFWLLMFSGTIINIVLAVVYAIKAGQGEWADYPIFGKLARRILKLGPGGATL